MPKAIPPKCRNCAASLSATEAMGRSCWVGSVCPNRRKHLRYNAKRKRRTLAVPEGALAVPMSPVAYLVLRIWQTPQQRHAIGLELWRDDQLIDQALPVHIVGQGKRAIDAWVAGASEGLRERNGEPDAVIRETPQHHPDKCPIENCSLRGHHAAP